MQRCFEYVRNWGNRCISAFPKSPHAVRDLHFHSAHLMFLFRPIVYNIHNQKWDVHPFIKLSDFVLLELSVIGFNDFVTLYKFYNSATYKTEYPEY